MIKSKNQTEVYAAMKLREVYYVKHYGDYCIIYCTYCVDMQFWGML